MRVKPLVSIILPTHNSQDFISQTIDSIISQTYKKWELIITDDYSTDDTIEIIKNYQKNENRIKIFLLNQNKGTGFARNNSIKNSNGRFIAFCDSDDMWKKNKLEVQVDFILKNDLCITYSAYHIINEKGKNLGKMNVNETMTFSRLLRNNYFGCLTVIYDVKKLGKKYMPIIRKRQDWVLWLSILKEISFTKGLNKSLAIYRNRSSSLSSNKIEMLKCNWKVYKYELGYGHLKSIYLITQFLFFYFFKRFNITN